MWHVGVCLAKLHTIISAHVCVFMRVCGCALCVIFVCMPCAYIQYDAHDPCMSCKLA